MMTKNLNPKSYSHEYSPIQELKSAKEFGGVLQPNSGRGYKKGDWVKYSKNGEKLLVVDDKNTTKSSFSVTRKILEKIENDALGQNALPLLHVEINSDTISAKEFFVMPKWALLALLAELENE